MQNIYFNGSFSDELNSKYLAMFTDCIAQETDALIQELSVLINPDELSVIKQAIEWGNSLTYGTRVVDKYYFSHALRITRFVLYNIRYKHLTNTLPEACGRSGLCNAMLAALFHNAFEKKLMSVDAFSEKFGEYYAEAILYITVDRLAMKTEAGLRDHYSKLAGAPEWVQGMRGLDKADNLLVLHINPDEQVRKDYIIELETRLIPLLRKNQPELADMLLGECKWASTKEYGLPTPEQLSKLTWSYKPYNA